MDTASRSNDSWTAPTLADPADLSMPPADEHERTEWLLRVSASPSADSSASTGFPTTSSSRSSSRSTTSRTRSTRSSARSAPCPINKQIILVDDCSKDGTRDILRELADERARPDDRLPREEPGQGRGACAPGSSTPRARSSSSRTPTSNTTRRSIPQLIQPIVEGKADVVYGSRFIGETHRVLYFWHSLANKFLTLLSNMFTNLNLTDMEVCYKVFRREVIQGITLKSDRFGFEPEVTAKVARFQMPAARRPPARRAGSTRCPVSYNGRDYREGKKIGWKDGVQALYCIVRYAIAD